ncbi:hypothetical protein O181_116643 [Austropuccinia psidii MF-1]|uniref:Uncharacterized protein n=1 Tax=Austropuccinia psidii MF-1 TaxID=1389203 RepID=A0A9Q3K8P8_9BASI|nr:hypothetical protein [Austropuccinia psidii MF-1]
MFPSLPSLEFKHVSPHDSISDSANLCIYLKSFDDGMIWNKQMLVHHHIIRDYYQPSTPSSSKNQIDIIIRIDYGMVLTETMLANNQRLNDDSMKNLYS